MNSGIHLFDVIQKADFKIIDFDFTELYALYLNLKMLKRGLKVLQSYASNSFQVTKIRTSILQF